MGLSINDCIIHGDGHHNFFDACNWYLFGGGTYYHVHAVSERELSQRRFNVVRDEQELSRYYSCLLSLSYILVVPTIIAYIGVAIGRCLNHYDILQPVLIPVLQQPIPPVPVPRQLPFAARPVVSTNVTTIIPTRNLLRLRNHLSSNTLPNFKLDRGRDLYSCVLNDSFINIRNVSAPESAKIKFKVNDSGNVTSFHIEMLSVDTIPKEDEATILAAIAKMNELIGPDSEVEQKEADEKHSISNELFPAEDLLLIRHHFEKDKITKFSLTIDDISWSISCEKGAYNQPSKIRMTNESHLDGYTVTVTFHSETGKILDYDNTIEKVKAALQDCYLGALGLSSKYTNDGSNQISVKVVQKSLQMIPAYHLESFTKFLRSIYSRNSTPSMSVNFLTSRLVQDDGSDGGGLSRTYLDRLVTELKKGKIDLLPDGSVLALPKTKNAYDEKNPDLSPKCDELEIRRYEQLGLLMRFSLTTDARPIGRHFHHALFQVVACLKWEEVATSFENLSLETRVKMHEALIDKVYDWNFSQSRTLLKYLRMSMRGHLSESDKKEAIEFVQKYDSDIKPEDLRDSQTLKHYLSRMLMSTSEHACLAPIHAIARGMKEHLSKDLWSDKLYQKDPIELSLKIQGVTDRKSAADCFKVDTGIDRYSAAYREINEKITWLKEWIQDLNTTEDEISDLLRFFTGCSGVPKDREIRCTQQTYNFSPYPVAHTCAVYAEFAPRPLEFVPRQGRTPPGVKDCPPERNTKEAFIKIIKAAISDPYSYQRG